MMKIEDFKFGILPFAMFVFLIFKLFEVPSIFGFFIIQAATLLFFKEYQKYLYMILILVAILCFIQLELKHINFGLYVLINYVLIGFPFIAPFIVYIIFNPKKILNFLIVCFICLVLFLIFIFTPVLFSIVAKYILKVNIEYIFYMLGAPCFILYYWMLSIILDYFVNYFLVNK